MKTNHFKELFKKSSVLFVLKALGAALAFVFQWEVAQKLGASGAGVIFIVLMVVSIGATIARLGMEKPLLKIVASSAAGDHTRNINIIWKHSMVLGLFASLFLGLLTGLWGENIGLIPMDKGNMLGVLSGLLLVVMTLTLLQSHALQGIGNLQVAILTERLLPLGMASLLFFLFFPMFLSEVAAVLALFCGWLISLMIGIIVWKKNNFYKDRGSKASESENKALIAGFHSSSKAMFLGNVFNQLTVWVGVAVITFFLTTEDVGRFGMAQRVSMLVAFALGAVNVFLMPKFAALHSDGDMKELAIWSRKSSRFMGLVALPFFIVCVFFGESLMALFGHDFIVAAPILSVIAFGQVANAFFGPLGSLLLMTGHEKVVSQGLAGLFVGTLVLSVVLVPLVGAIGAAISSALVLILWNLWMFTRVQKHLDFKPYI